MPVLDRRRLGRFFRRVAVRLDRPLRLVLTGGAEALLLGATRPTVDVDFEIVFSPKRDDTAAVEVAIAAAAREAGVAVQYSTDIDRWSSVSIPSSRRRTRPYRRFGKLSIHLLDPACWAVYKLARYLESDVEDLVAVLRRQRVSATRFADLCGHALRASPRSTQLFAFRRQVEHFFETHGRAIWGTRFDPRRATAVFHRAARIG